VLEEFSAEILYRDPSLEKDGTRVVTLLSDGIADNHPAAVEVASRLKNKGILIFGIFAGDDPNGIANMRELASTPSDTFIFSIGADDNDVERLTKMIIERSCLHASILSSYCGLQGTNITVNGTNLYDTPNLKCKFIFSDGIEEIGQATFISETSIICRARDISSFGRARLLVSNDGSSFHGSNSLNFEFVENLNTCKKQIARFKFNLCCKF